MWQLVILRGGKFCFKAIRVGTTRRVFDSVDGDAMPFRLQDKLLAARRALGIDWSIAAGMDNRLIFMAILA